MTNSTVRDGAGWRPIDTAPKDGTHVLLWCIKSAGEVSGQCAWQGMAISSRDEFWDGKSDFPGDGWWPTDGDYYATWCWPTHWMPLPPPPTDGPHSTKDASHAE